MYDHIIMQLKVNLSALKYEHEDNAGRYIYDREGKSSQGAATKRAIESLEDAINDLYTFSNPLSEEVGRLSDRVSELEAQS